MFLNKFCNLLLNLAGNLACYLFGRKRKRFPSRFTEEYLAAIVKTCPVKPMEEGPGGGGDMDGEPPAILPEGYARVRHGKKWYTFLKCCHICGKFGDHLAEDCAIKPCDSEYFRTRFMTPAPKAELFLSQELL